MNIKYNSNIAFSSKIKFVSETEFKKMSAKDARQLDNPNYIANPWNYHIVGGKGLTEDICACCAGGLSNTNSKDVVMFHYTPAAFLFPYDRFEKIFYESLSKMGQYTEKLHGFIIGGKTKESGVNNHCSSKKLSEKLVEFLTSLNASITKFWGQKTSGSCTNIYYSGEEDTWYILYTDKNKFYDPQLIKTADDIKNAYQDIKIAKEDSVFIGDKYVDKFDLKHRYKKIDSGYEVDLNYFSNQFNYNTIAQRKVKLYLGDYGKDRTTLWVEAKNEEEVLQVLDIIDEIKEAPLFRNIQKIQYLGTKALADFSQKSEGCNDKQIFEKKI